MDSEEFLDQHLTKISAGIVAVNDAVIGIGNAMIAIQLAMQNLHVLLHQTQEVFESVTGELDDDVTFERDDEDGPLN